MDKRQQVITNKLQVSRKSLLGLPKSTINGSVIYRWYESNQEIFDQADTISEEILRVDIHLLLKPYKNETDQEVCLDLRTSVVDLIDKSIIILDSSQVVKPILEDQILKVSDSKLSALLREFNACKTEQPNLACAGFRTILPLIIRERAKIVDTNNLLATKNDIGFEPDIKKAIADKTLFTSAEKKLLNRYLIGGDKDSFDNVVHKADYLIDKAELEDAVGLLNRLLPTITDK